MANPATALKPVLDVLDEATAVIAREHGIKGRISLVVGATGGGKKHGHFHANTWADRNDPAQSYHEIMLSGESLERGAVGTLGTLIHELAHAYNFENDIRDVSDSGRYHNDSFKRTAERMGLEIEKAARIGWSVTTVPPQTRQKYAALIEKLEKAIIVFRRGDLGLAADGEKQPKWHMGCPECEDEFWVPIQKRWYENQEYSLRCEIHNRSLELDKF